MLAIHPQRAQYYAGKLREKWANVPGLTDRLDRAVQLLIGGNVTADRGQFLILSSKNDGSGYTIDALGRCNCRDFHAAPVLGNARYCKHKLAVSIYRKFIREEMTPRLLIGANAITSRHNRDEAKFNTKSWLYLDNVSLKLSSARHPLGTVTNDAEGWRPANDAAYIAVAQFLEDADPIPRPRIMDTSVIDAGLGLPPAQWQELYGLMYTGLRH